MTKANEIYMNAESIDGVDKVVISKMDFNYLVRMAKALEQINNVQQKVYAGEIDGFDFGEQVEDILQTV